MERDGLPAGREIELLAEASGLLQGMFLLTGGHGPRPSLEQRLVTVALADQAGAALSGGKLAWHSTSGSRRTSMVCPCGRACRCLAGMRLG